MFKVMCAMYGLGFWYGIKCIVDDREGEVFIELFCLFLNLCSQVCKHCWPAGDIACNSYFLTLVDLTLILFTIYSDFTQSFTLNDYQVDGGIGTEIGNWTTMELDRTEVLDTVAW